MGKVITTFFVMMLGAVTFCMGIILMGLDLPRDEMLWLWNLGCSGLAVGGIVTFFAPVFVLTR